MTINILKFISKIEDKTPSQFVCEIPHSIHIISILGIKHIIDLKSHR